MATCTQQPEITVIEHQEISFEFPCESGVETYYHMIGRDAAGRRYAYSRRVISREGLITCEEVNLFRELPCD